MRLQYCPPVEYSGMWRGGVYVSVLIDVPSSCRLCQLCCCAAAVRVRFD